jgi:hypothetical protein
MIGQVSNLIVSKFHRLFSIIRCNLHTHHRLPDRALPLTPSSSPQTAYPGYLTRNTDLSYTRWTIPTLPFFPLFLIHSQQREDSFSKIHQKGYFKLLFLPRYRDLKLAYVVRNLPILIVSSLLHERPHKTTFCQPLQEIQLVCRSLLRFNTHSSSLLTIVSCFM